jgi:hypothetical protein
MSPDTRVRVASVPRSDETDEKYPFARKVGT